MEKISRGIPATKPKKSCLADSEYTWLRFAYLDSVIFHHEYILVAYLGIVCFMRLIPGTRFYYISRLWTWVFFQIEKSKRHTWFYYWNVDFYSLPSLEMGACNASCNKWGFGQKRNCDILTLTVKEYLTSSE